MSSCGYSSSCPEPVNVNITNQVIQIGDFPAMHRVETFTYSDTDSDSRTNFVLSFIPYEPKSVQLFLNSIALRYGIDYIVQGSRVILTSPLTSGDEILSRYLSIDGTNVVRVFPVGVLVSFPDSAGEVDGFLEMDGSTVHSWTFYPSLKTWFDAAVYGPTRKADLLQSYDSDTFVLKALFDSAYDGSSLVSLSKYISLGSS